MVKNFVAALALGALILLGFAATRAQAQGAAPPAQQAAPTPSQTETWQARRLRTLDVIRVMKDPQADKATHQAAFNAFDAILSRFEKAPYRVTPMEAMDLYQLFYLTREADKMASHLLMISWSATLGWYDALRFADDSGRAEILNVERFFDRALRVRRAEYQEFLKKEPQKAAAAVAEGIASARKMVAATQGLYDVRWPVAYGLLAAQCASQGGKSCARPPELPPDKWPAAFEDAVARVQQHYSQGLK